MEVYIMKISEKQKTELVSRYQSGESAKVICQENKIAKSTFYDWLKKYKITILPCGAETSAQEFMKLKSHAEKQRQLIELLHTVSCAPASPLQEKLNEMEKLHGQYSVHALCEALDVSRGTFYNHILRNKRDNKESVRRRQMLMPLIRKIFEENRQIFGARKIKAVLADRGYNVSPELISELMKEMDLESVSTNSKREYKRRIKEERKNNIMDQHFNVEHPNTVWTCDFTSFWIKEKRIYVCAILDLFSRKVIAYKISSSATTNSLTSTFKQALKGRTPICENLMFHSDQGSQFTSYTFRRLLKQLGITQSFSAPGNPYNNSVSEAFFSHFKREELYRREYQSEKEFCNNVKKYISFYNEKRPHKTIGYKTPCAVEKNYYKQNNIGQEGSEMQFF